MPLKENCLTVRYLERNADDSLIADPVTVRGRLLLQRARLARQGWAVAADLFESGLPSSGRTAHLIRFIRDRPDPPARPTMQ